MTKKTTKIVLAGEGGQGIQTIAKILSLALEKTNCSVSYIPQFGPEQRGTPSVAFIQFGDEPIYYSQFSTADILVVLHKRALVSIDRFIGPKTEIVFDSSTIPRRIIQQNNKYVFGIPATKLAEEKFKSKSLNLIVLAAISKRFFDYPKNALWEIVEKQLYKKFAKNPEIEKNARDAFDFGYEFELENKNYSKAEFDVASGIIIKKNTQRTAVIIPKYCKGCGICIEKCPVDALSFGKTLGVFGTPVPEIDLDKCIACGNCFRYCLDSAIRVVKK